MPDAILRGPSASLRNRVGITLIALSVFVFAATFIRDLFIESDNWFPYAAAVVVMLIGVVVLGLAKFKGKVTDGALDMESTVYSYLIETETLKDEIPTRELDHETRERRQEYALERAKNDALPGQDAPRYSVFSQSDAANVLVRPSAYPVTPMYLLDSAYRVTDWNEAFSLAFDKTMEGRQGRSVLEWTYFLDNYEQVLDHGMKCFGDPENLPVIDVEPIEYTSMRYGRILATKRAYRIPDDDGRCMAWLITIEPTFETAQIEERYKDDLQRILGLDQLWSEYAISYDKLLTKTRVYNDLLRALLGEVGDMPRIRDGARILDLGAGTGNLSKRVMESCPNSLVVALDNNRAMLDLLRMKCRPYLRRDDQGPGVLVCKQDITSLYGLDDNSFDYVLSNNVFYAVSDTESALKEVRRVLKPGGELRVSGPRADTNLEVLFRRIRADLEETGEFKNLEKVYKHVKQLNELRLRPMLHRWTTDDFSQLLTSQEIGFATVTHRSENVYEGQSMLISAVKGEAAREPLAA